MAKYTISLYELAIEKSMKSKLPEQLEDLRKYLFSFEYEMYKPEHKKIFETKFIRHYLMYEIGLETPQLFKVFLESRLYEIMPYYNQLYKMQELFNLINVLEDRNMYNENETDEDETHQDSINTNEDTTTTDSENIIQNIDTDDNENGTRSIKEDEEQSKIDNIKENVSRDSAENSNNTNIYDESRYKKNNYNEDNESNNVMKSTDTIDSDTSDMGRNTGTVVTTAHNTNTHDIDEKTYEENNKGLSDYPQGNVANNKDYFSNSEIYKGKGKNYGLNVDTEDIDQTVTNNLYNKNAGDKSETNTKNSKEYNTLEKNGDSYEKEDIDKNDKAKGTIDKNENENKTNNSNENTNLDKTTNETYKNSKDNSQSMNNKRNSENEYNRLMKEARDLIRNLQRYDKGHEHGLTGNRTIAEMINEYKDSYFDVDILLINELNDIFMNIY